MLFMVGIHCLSYEEKIALLAQMNVLNGVNLLNEAVQKSARLAKRTVLQTVERVANKVDERFGKGIAKLNEGSDWDTNVLARRLEEETRKLAGLAPEEVAAELKRRMADIAGVDETAGEEAIVRGILRRASKSLNIDRECCPDDALESRVFEETVRQQADRLKKQLEGMSDEQQEEFAERVRRQIAQLGKAEQDAVKQALGADNLSRQTLLRFLKKTSGVAIAQLVAGGLGFGAFLFLSEAISALGLLLGITFPFAVYTTASSMLAFVLSGPFFLAAAVLFGGLALGSMSKRMGDEMAKLLVVVGRAKLIARS